ncbi:hypothetical protein DBB36_22965 [Flavobacterium sp. WLB]|nr:hypothetical protein AKO67_15625 [Flavobacterium sp. VMW]OWU90863.1 hypothetical protein APR43_10310 [Flavobacterium sp. NLM]PUU67629.1 hypothetical protein DBB36_22965 [Flavobacterium sp. WLB]
MIEVFALKQFLLKVCHFDGGEISASNSAKIGDILYGASRGDFSSVEMTKLSFITSLLSI